jgi:hypothetical protein
MAKSIGSSKQQLQSQKPARHRNKSCAPAPPSGPTGPVPQKPLFWLLALLASGSAWFAIQQGLLGTMAVFLAALSALMLKSND